MKICLISNLYGDNARGGAERVVEAEARQLSQAGHEVTIIAGWAGETVPAESVVDGIRILRLRPPNIFFYTDLDRHSWPVRLLWHLIDTFNFRSAVLVRDILAREKPDIVHTHNLMGLGFLVPRMIRRLGFRHIHTVHDVQLIHPSGLIPASGRLPFGSRWHAAAIGRLFGSPAVVIFPSRFLNDLCGRFGFFPSSRLLTLPNPAPVSETSSRLAPTEPVFLFAGQLERHKGILELLISWRTWPKNGNAQLELAGAGSLEAEVRRRADELKNVRFLGRLDAAGMRAAYDRAAFLVVPSLVIENYPTVIIEAFSRGTPVVAAAAGGIPELVSESQTGFLFAPGDVFGLSNALDKAFEAMPDWLRLSEQARRRVAESSHEAHAEALLAVYRGESGR